MHVINQKNYMCKQLKVKEKILRSVNNVLVCVIDTCVYMRV